VRVLAVDQRQRAQRPEIFFAVGDLCHSFVPFFVRGQGQVRRESQGAVGR
jgi:hypothetical protein